MISHSRQQYLDELKAGKTERHFKGINPDSEDAIQANFFEWITLHEARFPVLELFYAIPNGGKRGKLVGWILKLTGTRPGVPDTNLPTRRGLYAGLWIEFKRPGEKLRKEQVEWVNRLKAQGHRVEVCYSWTEAANVTIDYLQLDLERL